MGLASLLKMMPRQLCIISHLLKCETSRNLKHFLQPARRWISTKGKDFTKGRPPEAKTALCGEGCSWLGLQTTMIHHHDMVIMCLYQRVRPNCNPVVHPLSQ